MQNLGLNSPDGRMIPRFVGLYFAQYANDLPEPLPHFIKVNLYADDTALTVSSAPRDDLE